MIRSASQKDAFENRNLKESDERRGRAKKKERKNEYELNRATKE